MDSNQTPWGDGPQQIPWRQRILCCGSGVLCLFHTPGARAGFSSSSGAQNKLYSKSGLTHPDALSPLDWFSYPSTQTQDKLRSTLNIRAIVSHNIQCLVKLRLN